MTTPPDPNPSPQALSHLDTIAQLSHGFKNGEPGARQGLLDACRHLIAEISHPSENMLQLLWAQPAHLNVLWMATEVKLFQAMQSLPPSGASASEIASQCDANKNVDPILVGRMLRHLSAMGTVRETGPGIFSHTPTSSAFAQPAYQDSILYIAENFQPVHQSMKSYLSEHGWQNPDSGVDGPFQHAYGCKGSSYFDFFAQQPEIGRRFASMMDMWSRGRPRWFDTEYYPVEERLIRGVAETDAAAPFLVDVGGGTGHDVEGLREAFQGQLPGKLILQDRPEIVKLASLGPGVDGMPHDFLTEQPVKGARAYYLHSIIQDWNDQVCTTILKAIVPAMKRGHSKVLVNDFVVPTQGAHWAQSKPLHLLLRLFSLVSLGRGDLANGKQRVWIGNSWPVWGQGTAPRRSIGSCTRARA
ncbi:winged helix-turn-helix transcription repressor dna-binding [Pyrenophora seminiperda CCB06]|uniref:Winged helix-turn-helix transcription repressor dna-binding n=1 Tax=Pyrenophora seminiperda CCB06 TaxID=1302712 RepID=A0A3M7M499_9PLEO|nr:winged helix-turn-helix transcription repressor dna-binding [Pyrenophora seminiperda CCB06]